MESSSRVRRGYYTNQNFKIWLHLILSKLPLTKALIGVILVTTFLFILVQVLGLHEIHSPTVLILHERNRNFRIMMDEKEDSLEDLTQHVMTVQLHGRTGNMMFAYASLLGLSKSLGRTAVFPSDHYFRILFKIKAKPYNQKGIKTWIKFAEKHASIYDERILDAGDGNADMVELLGYFQSWKYFEHIKDEIRTEFTFQGEILERASHLIELAIKRTFGRDTKRADATLVGLHVRRGDMTQFHSYELGYTTASSRYIADAMEYFTNRFNDSKLLFVLCSDDFGWCNENVKEASVPIIRFEQASDVTHLAILSSCNHSIMTVGSFGWWGSWLAGGETVYYKNFPRPASPLSNEFLEKDYYYPGWIGM